MSRNLILITVMTGTFMAALDNSIVNISLPVMAHQFHASLTQIQWVILAYMIAFASVIPLTSWLRERLGFRNLYIGSLFLFVLGSALCGASTTLNELVAARVLQALGGGALTPTAMAILSTVYPPHERGGAIGVWGLGVVIGPAVGPTLGGVLTAQFGWPSIFYINVPIGILGIALAFHTLQSKELTSRSSASLDVPGFVALTTFLVSLLFSLGVLEQRQTSSFALFPWTIAVFSLVAFIFLSIRSRNPILDIRIFLNSTFRACTLVTIARSAGLYGGLFLLPFLMQNLLGFSEVQSGLLMLPGSLLLVVLMPFAGRWTDSHGPRNIVLAGLLAISLSLAIFGFVPLYGTLLMILAGMLLRGVGLGLLVAPISTTLVNSVPQRQVTLASSINSLLQQCGGALGVSLFAVVHETAFQRAAALGRSALAAESFALKLSFFTTSGAILLALVPALTLPKAAPPKKEIPRALIE